MFHICIFYSSLTSNRLLRPFVNRGPRGPLGILDRSGVVADARNGYGYTKEWAQGLENRLKDLLHD